MNKDENDRLYDALVNMGYQPTVEAISNIPPSTGSSVQNKSYQSNMIDSSIRTKLAKLAEYEVLEKQCGYNIAEAIQGLSGEILRLKDELQHYKNAEDESICTGCRYESLDGEDMPCKYCSSAYTNEFETVEPYMTEEEFLDYTRGDKL